MEEILLLHGHRFCPKMFHNCILARRCFAKQPLIFPRTADHTLGLFVCLFVDNEHMLGQFGIVWPYSVIRDYFQTIYILSLRCDYSVITGHPFVTLFCHRPPNCIKLFLPEMMMTNDARISHFEDKSIFLD